MLGTAGIIILKVVVAVALVAVGLVIVGLGQVFEAAREIALNTRAMAYASNPAAAPRDSYAGLAFIAIAATVAGAALALVAVMGLFVAL